MNMNMKKLFWATSALTGGLLVSSVALAQSTGTQVTEEVIVTGQRGPRTIDGAMIAETAPKTRSTITQQFIATQVPGQTIIESLNLVPGLNFTNNDPYGSSGGNLRLRGFDGNRVSLTFDGIPLNDTGNYAIYTNQQLDPELIDRAVVNVGTTDVDSPTASAVGGTINYITRRPDREFGGIGQASVGSFAYKRFFGLVDTGEFGPWGTTAWLSASYTNYDKFKGPGEIDKKQFNGRLYQPLSGSDYVSLAFHYNQNRNNFYRNPTLAQYNADPNFDNDILCSMPTPGPGAQNDATQSNITTYNGVTTTGSCTSYHGLRINPSNTGNIRGSGRFTLADNLTLTVDPSVQYVLANGGGFSTLAENSARAKGALQSGPGTDFNGDGDFLDTVAFYSPNTTNTMRYGVTSSLIWDFMDSQRLRVAYTFDYGRHRQTGEWTTLSRAGEPADVFGGKGGYGPKVMTADGNFLQQRNRFSIASLQQVAFDYRGQFLDDALVVNIGVRAPFFERDLNQYCFSQNASSTVVCTAQPVVATLPNGNVQLAGQGSTQYVEPFSRTLKYDAVLPNLGVSYRFGDAHTVYASYAEGFSAPRTDNLYQPFRSPTATTEQPIRLGTVEPETTKTYDLGYRYYSGNLFLQAALWRTDFENRIVSAFDEELNTSIDRNVGDAELWGLDVQAEYQFLPSLSGYVSASYNESEIKNDVRVSLTNSLPTAGKTFVETPPWTYAARLNWEPSPAFNAGVQYKWTGKRFATDVNDQFVPSYQVVDLDARVSLDHVIGAPEGTYLQFNVKNLFDEDYLGGISTRTNAVSLPGRSGSSPTYTVGAPRTFVATIRYEF
jgi:iron complex outermembrane receptor protein